MTKINKEINKEIKDSIKLYSIPEIKDSIKLCSIPVSFLTIMVTSIMKMKKMNILSLLDPVT